MAPDLLVAIGWKSLVLSTVTLLLLRCFGRLSAHKRALIGHGGIAAALLLLPLTVWGPAWNLEVGGLRPPDGVLAHSDGPISAENSAGPRVEAGSSSLPLQGIAAPEEPNPLAMVTPLYACIALFLLLSTVASVARADAVARRSLPVTDATWRRVLGEQQAMLEIARPVDLRISTDLGAPISLGFRRTKIILDPESAAAPAAASAVLGHELAHIASQDWCKLLLCRVATAALWFNPAIWMLARACAQYREEAADDIVLRGQVRCDDYASLLVEVASRQPRRSPAMANSLARRHALKRRLIRILAERTDRTPAGRFFKAACVAIVCLALPLAALTPTAAALPPTSTGAFVPATSNGSSQHVSPGGRRFGGGGAALIAGGPVVPSAGAGGWPSRHGSLALPSLHAIQVYGWADVRVRHGTGPALRVVSGSVEHAVFDVDRAGRLSVMACTQSCPRSNLVLEVTSPTLPPLAVIGGGAIAAQRGFPAQSDVRVSVTGGGTVDFGAIKAPAGRVDIIGGGSVLANADAELTTNITDGGSVVRRARRR